MASNSFINDMESIFAIGDIVVPKATTRPDGEEHCRYGWYEGDKRWICRTGLGLHDDPNCYDFYYVVTAIDGHSRYPHPHEIRYHVRTLALLEKACGGWTTMTNHIKMVKAEDPPEYVLKSSLELIGQLSNILL